MSMSGKKTALAGLMLLGTLGMAGGVLASTRTVAITNPPTATQVAEFYKVCMGIADNETLCSCKADAAPKLIDTDFMAIVIASMKGKTLETKYSVPYDTYVARSNQICKPGY